MKNVMILAAIAFASTFSLPALAQQAPEAGKAAAKNHPTPDILRQGPQSDPSAPISVGQAPLAVLQQPGESRHWTSIEIVLSFSVLVFGAMVFGLQTWLIVKMPLQWTPNAILRFNGLTLIITGSILLVTVGYSSERMTPVIGLLGAIAGYLLGSVDKPEANRPDSRPSDETAADHPQRNVAS